MKLRVLLVLAVVLLICAAALWLWPAGSGNLAPAAGSLPALATPVPSAGAAASPAPVVSSPTPVPTEPVRTASAVLPGAPMVRSTPAPPAKVATAPVSAPAGAQKPEREGTRDLEEVRAMFSNFHTRLGENPVGSNAEIMKAIMGGNTAGARLGPPAGQELNANGELVDRWGTPYFFHQLAKDKMEIRSAGPDMKMWTVDDLITR